MSFFFSLSGLISHPSSFIEQRANRGVAKRWLVTAGVCAALAVGILSPCFAQTKTATGTALTDGQKDHSGNVILPKSSPDVSIAELQLALEPNVGQASSDQLYVAHSGLMQVGFQAASVNFEISSASEHRKLTMTLAGANKNVGIEASEKGHGESNYLIDNDSAAWKTHIPQYGRLTYREVYSGIDLTFYGSHGHLEHDFVVQPGADYRQIKMNYEGADKLALSSNGELHLSIGASDLIVRAPQIYQKVQGHRQDRTGRFVLLGEREAVFKIDAYDHSLPLVIDPVIDFSTYLGGTGADFATAVTTDASGNILVTGYTSSTDFPTNQAIQPSLGSGGQSVFVTKLDPTGKTLIYSTYLGGSNGNIGGAIAVDANGNAIVAGVTSSSNFPLAGAGSSLSCQINYNCFFITSLSPNGSKLNYSGMVGGEQGFYVFGAGAYLAVDTTGNAYLTGTTDINSFQITAGTLATSVAGYPYNETFVLKVDPTGKLLYSTVIPGNDTNSADLIQPYTNDFIPGGIAVDASGNVTIAGTAGLGLPTTAGVVGPQFPNAYVNVENPSAGFVLQMNPTASVINFASYLPGTDYCRGLAVDGTGNLYLTGGTQETNLPVSANAYQKAPVTISGGQIEGAYVMVLNSQATAIVAATYLGAGAVGGYGFSAIALDSRDNIFVGGSAEGQRFPLLDPFVTEYEYTESIADLILAEVSPDLSTLKFGSFLSATSGTYAGSVFADLAVDKSDNLIVSGTTFSFDFPTTSGSFEPQLPAPANPLIGYQHSFVTKIDMSTPAPAICFSAQYVAFGNVNANTSATNTLNATNCGNAPLTISAITSSDPTVVATENCGSIAAGATCAVTLTFTPVSSLSTSSTITFTDNAATLPQTVAATGQGIAPEIVANPTSVSFGHLFVGTPAVSSTVLLENQGKATLSISSASVTGSGFSLTTNDCTQTLPSRDICVIFLSFSPMGSGAQTGSLIVSSNDPVNPQLTIPLAGVGDSVYAVPTIASIGAGTVQINAGSQMLQISGTNFYPQSVVQVAGVAQHAKFISNTSLQATIVASSLTSIGELQLAVVNPSPGGGYSPSATLTPYQTLVIDPAAIVAVPATGKIYVAIPANATSNPNTVIPIDPTTGTQGTPIGVGNNPELLAASSDGSYLYVGNQGSRTVQRINLATNTVERTFPYTLDPSCTDCTSSGATDLAAVPGNPTEVLLSQGSWLSLFNDAGLVNYVPIGGRCCYADPDFGSIALAGNPLAVYGLPFSFGGGFFQIASLTDAGLQYTYPTGSSSGFNNTTGAQVISDGTLLYTSAGQVWNPATQTEIGTFTVTSFNITSYPNMRALSLDTSLGEIYWIGYQDYFSSNSSLAGVISAYGMKSHALTGILAFPQMDYPDMGNLVRWGTNGLAFIGPGAGLTDQELYLLRSSVVSPQAPSPTPTLTSISPSSANAGSPAFTLSVKGTGFLPSSVVDWNGTELATTYVSGQQLAAAIPASDIAAPGVTQVAVFNGAPGGGSSTALTFNVVAMPAITWATPSAITYGTALSSTQLDASSTVAGTFAYSPAVGTVLTAGVQTLTATFTPTDSTDYTTANATVSLNVNQATPAVTWATPAAIPFGAALGSAQLDATASVPGSFAYNPQAGTVLSAGNNTLSVNFTPSDATDYTSANAKVTLAVGQPAPVAGNLSPALESAGGAAFTLTVNGSGFTAASVVYWGPAALPTQYVSGAQLTAQVPVTSIATAGIYAVAVQSPIPGGNTSNALQFEVDSGTSGSGPSFTTVTATVAPGATASYPVTLPSSASDVTVTCLNLPARASCSYSASSGAITIATTSATPAGTYQITVVFTETLPGAATAFVVLPILLLPLLFVRRKLGARGLWFTACLGLVLMTAAAFSTGCGGGSSGGGGSTPPQTHVVTSSGSVSLTVQ